MIEITMPQAGQSMEEGTIIAWLKAEGDAISAGEVIAEIETDKATLEFESPEAGTLLKILQPEGATVAVHTPIAILGGPGEEVSGIQTAGAGAAAGAKSAVIPVLMPQAGQSMEEGTVIEWFVKPGDQIKVGDVIFEVETDKAAVEVEAMDAGRLARIVVGEGETVPVKTVVAYLAESDSDLDSFIAAQAAPARGPQPVAPSTGQADLQSAQARRAAHTAAAGRVKASPAARKAAAEAGIDLAAMAPGSGPGGRIVSADVLKAAKAKSPAQAPAGQAVRRTMTKMRKAIAASVKLSKETIPHFYARVTIDAGPMLAFYQAAKAGCPCSLNDVVTLAAARAVGEFAAFRSRIEGDEIVELAEANIGIAVATDEGLVVPVIRDAARMDLEQVAAESRRAVEAARAGKLEAGRGVFTITNLGMFGVQEFAAIINPPESAILAVGAVREDMIVSGGVARAGKVMTLTLSSDHRVIDGIMAAKFLARLKELLERPELLS